MSANPRNTRQRDLMQMDGRPGSGAGVEGIIQNQPAYQAQQAAAAQQAEEDYYAGLSADSPPLNRTFGEVVTLEKTDIQFVFLAVQTMLLLLIYLEVK